MKSNYQRSKAQDQRSKIKDPIPKAPDQIAAVVLAAGRSRRMGAFKPLLPFGDKTVIETIVDNFFLVSVQQIIVVTGHRAEDVQRQLDRRPLTLVLNPNPDSEMSASISLGVAATDPAIKALLITPVDHPAVPPEIIERLVIAWRRGAKLIQPEFEGQGGHPVLIDLGYRDELSALNARTGLRGFFDRHRADVLRLAVDSPFVARDMDTWDDYASLHEAVFGRGPKENRALDDSNR